MRGRGVDKDEQKMIEWWRRAAELGSVDAQANLYGMLKGDQQ